jgi:hypothetical protein
LQLLQVLVLSPATHHWQSHAVLQLLLLLLLLQWLQWLLPLATLAATGAAAAAAGAQQAGSRKGWCHGEGKGPEKDHLFAAVAAAVDAACCGGAWVLQRHHRYLQYHRHQQHCQLQPSDLVGRLGCALLLDWQG